MLLSGKTLTRLWHQTLKPEGLPRDPKENHCVLRRLTRSAAIPPRAPHCVARDGGSILLAFNLLSQKLEAYFFVSIHKDLLEHCVPCISKLPQFSSHGHILRKIRAGGLPDILRKSARSSPVVRKGRAPHECASWHWGKTDRY